MSGLESDETVNDSGGDEQLNFFGQDICSTAQCFFDLLDSIGQPRDYSSASSSSSSEDALSLDDSLTEEAIALAHTLHMPEFLSQDELPKLPASVLDLLDDTPYSYEVQHMTTETTESIPDLVEQDEMESTDDEVASQSSLPTDLETEFDSGSSDTELAEASDDCCCA